MSSLVLAEFDVRVGNRVLWASSNALDLTGIEFQMIPSGLHDVISDTIYFEHGNLKGCAVFSARPQASQNGGRRGITVYSLAALADQAPYKLETWLRGLLEKFIVVGDVNILESPSEPFFDSTCHPLLAAPDFIQSFGPQIYGLWKAGIVREKLLVHQQPSPSVRKLCQLSYIISLVGSIPSDVASLLPSGHPDLSYKCLYNVTLIDSQKLRSLDSFCACTTDALLVLPDRDFCDLVLDSTLRTIEGTTLYPTYRDRHRFTVNAPKLLPTYVPSTVSALDQIFESAAQGLLWWASAGDTCLVNDPEAQDTQDLEGVALVGLFHDYTRHLVKSFAALAEANDVLILGLDDIMQLGLDPFSRSDHIFLKKFAQVWFKREVHFKGMFCC